MTSRYIAVVFVCFASYNGFGRFDVAGNGAEDNDVTIARHSEFINSTVFDRLRIIKTSDIDTFDWSRRLDGFDERSVLTIILAANTRVFWYPWATAGPAVVLALQDFLQYDSLLRDFHFE